MRAMTGTGKRRKTSQQRWTAVMKPRALSRSSAAISPISARLRLFSLPALSITKCTRWPPSGRSSRRTATLIAGVISGVAAGAKQKRVFALELLPGGRHSDEALTENDVGPDRESGTAARALWRAERALAEKAADAVRQTLPCIHRTLTVSRHRLVGSVGPLRRLAKG